MTTDYNVTVETEVSAAQAEAVTDELYGTQLAEETYLSVHAAGERLAFTITVAAPNLGRAVADALLYATEAWKLGAYAVEALPTDEFDRRVDGGPQDSLSVPQAAAALGVSQQRVRQLLDAGKLTGTKVGRDWNVTAASVQSRIDATTQ